MSRSPRRRSVRPGAAAQGCLPVWPESPDRRAVVLLAGSPLPASPPGPRSVPPEGDSGCVQCSGPLPSPGHGYGWNNTVSPGGRQKRGLDVPRPQTLRARDGELTQDTAHTSPSALAVLPPISLRTPRNEISEHVLRTSRRKQVEGEPGKLNSMWVSGHKKLNLMKMLSSWTEKSEAGP